MSLFIFWRDDDEEGNDIPPSPSPTPLVHRLGDTQFIDTTGDAWVQTEYQRPRDYWSNRW